MDAFREFKTNKYQIDFKTYFILYLEPEPLFSFDAHTHLATTKCIGPKLIIKQLNSIRPNCPMVDFLLHFSPHYI